MVARKNFVEKQGLKFDNNLLRMLECSEKKEKNNKDKNQQFKGGS